MTAVMVLAEARFAASIMMSSSITASFTEGGTSDVTTNTWAPRTLCR